MIKPYNDHLLVEIKKSEWATADDMNEQNDPNAGSAVVVGIPDRKNIYYLSSYSWMAESTLKDKDILEGMHKAMEQLLGKKVYFEKRSDIGTTIEHEGKTYATIKLSKIIAVEE